MLVMAANAEMPVLKTLMKDELCMNTKTCQAHSVLHLPPSLPWGSGRAAGATLWVSAGPVPASLGCPGRQHLLTLALPQP